MSLPSHAAYYDADKNVIGHEFVNCGWFITARSVLKCLGELEEISPTAKYVVLYDCAVPISIVKALQNNNISEECVLDEYITESNTRYRASQQKRTREDFTK